MRYHGRRWNPLLPHLAMKFRYKLVHFIKHIKSIKHIKHTHTKHDRT